MSRSALAVLVVAFAAAHLPFLAPSLEDIDSVNFALGVRDFDVADHRPHPPGYPIYIALGKVAVAIGGLFAGGAAPSAVEARALSVLSLLGALAAIVLLYAVLSVWWAGADEADPVRPPWQDVNPFAMAATAVVAACPLFWYMAIRPMSDAPGLAAALAAQAALLLAWWRQRPIHGDRRLTPDRLGASGGALVLGAFLAALAIGFRSQNAVLTLPLLLGVLLDRTGRGVAGALLGTAVAAAVGGLIWGLPLIAASGGPNAYLDALGSQAGEDFAGVDMLYLNPAPRHVAMALLRTLVYPWDSLWLGGMMVALAVVGGTVLLLRDRRTAAATALTAGPYLIFHLLFHDTTFVRYALPLVPALTFLAVRGLTVIGPQPALIASGALALWAVGIAAPVAAAYGGTVSPTTRALGAMRDAAATNPPGALAMHQTFRRPLQAEDVPVANVLPSPPRREWLELVRYWQEGGTDPVWFLADPRRTDLTLIDPRSRAERREFSWDFDSLNALGGMRPAAVHWYRLTAPGWFAGEGWALTPETAGMARLAGRGPSVGPISAWIRRRPDAARMIVGGRHLGGVSDPSVQFTAAIDGHAVARWEASPGFFLREIDLPAGVLAGTGLAHLTIAAQSPSGAAVPTAIEQFDVQRAGDLMWGYGEGWHEAEFDPALGVWRWTSDAATLRVFGASGAVRVTMWVEPPSRYFDDQPTLRMRAGRRLIDERTLPEGGLWSVVVPADALAQADGDLTIETTSTFVPAERGSAPDQRRLGLRLFGVSLTKEH